MGKTLRLMLTATVAAAGLCLWLGTALASQDDYDPVTGQPRCTNCHTPDRSYSIDYSRDDTCNECHGAGLSDAYLDINDRYRADGEEGRTPDMEAYLKVAMAGAESATDASGKARTGAADEGAEGARGGGAHYRMVLIPGGEFTMGSNDWWPKSQPEHTRTIKPFYLDVYEVTNARYKRFVDATGRPAPDHWIDGRIPPGKEDHPVVFVSWYDADAFCKWEGKRLPRDDEWERAARGPEGWTFPWGNKFEKDYANTPQYGNEDTLPVGSFEKGKSYYGVYDMAGNAFEWTASWHKPYPGNNHPDENYGERYKVLKGGSWYDCTNYKCGISAPAYNRIFFHPRTKTSSYGFRCAQD
ncbi:MAG: formylglycine-generating enzyme family protein, partial [Thermodesulfobacteriota bacterium]